MAEGRWAGHWPGEAWAGQWPGEFLAILRSSEAQAGRWPSEALVVVGPGRADNKSLVSLIFGL